MVPRAPARLVSRSWSHGSEARSYGPEHWIPVRPSGDLSEVAAASLGNDGGIGPRAVLEVPVPDGHRRRAPALRPDKMHLAGGVVAVVPVRHAHHPGLPVGGPHGLGTEGVTVEVAAVGVDVPERDLNRPCASTLRPFITQDGRRRRRQSAAPPRLPRRPQPQFQVVASFASWPLLPIR